MGGALVKGAPHQAASAVKGYAIKGHLAHDNE